MNNTLDNVYTGVATYGKVSTYINFFIGTCIALIFCCVGFFINKSQRAQDDATANFITINANIIQKNVTSISKNNKISDITISYNINNVNYTNKLSISETFGSEIYFVGGNIPIKYNPIDPNNIIQVDTNIFSNYMGYFFMSFACIVFIILLINVILVSTNKVYAASSGISNIARI
jgi:hypothetical protein